MCVFYHSFRVIRVTYSLKMNKYLVLISTKGFIFKYVVDKRPWTLRRIKRSQMYYKFQY